MSNIIIKNLSKNYKDKKVLDNFSAVFKEKTFTCIEGPSGCGKTTLLNIISGLIAPDSGTIAGVPEKTAYVFQEDRLCEDFTALRNIRLVCNKEKTDEEILNHLKEVSLFSEANTPIRKLSGGMKRRISIVRAICYDADCILLDEPFKGLDEKLKQSVMKYVKKYTENKTVICVTHDPFESEYLSDSRLIIK